MRNFQTLDKVTVDLTTGIICMSTAQPTLGDAMLSMRREGEYVALSASHGPFEIALRPRFQDMTRIMGRLSPVDNHFATTRQVGTAQAYLALGLSTDGSLIMRPTIVADATGHLSFNLLLTEPVCRALFEWLSIKVEIQ